MKFNQDIYHLCIAYIGAGVLTIALILEIYHNINIYNQIMIGCLISFFWICMVKKEVNNKILMKGGIKKYGKEKNIIKN